MDRATRTYEYYLSRGGKWNRYEDVFSTFYTYLRNSSIKKDERVEKWLFMETPTITCGILIAYVLSIIFIRVSMSKRDAFELRTFLILYNLFQVIASFYIFAEVLF